MIKPFLKWVGGKRQLIGTIKDLLPDDYEERDHIEPFVGGGAVVFALQPKSAFISDYNKELIWTYLSVRDDWEYLFRKIFSMKNTKEDYYKYREMFNQTNKEGLSIVEQSALFIYLNRTGFNGMYRVNSEGKFNVPWGHNPHEDMSYFFNLDNVKSTAEYLKECVSITCETYSDVIDRHLNMMRDLRANKKFFYLDPPYAPLDKDIERGNFTAYTTFPGWEFAEQIKLRDKCEELDKAGQKFMLSNSSCKLVKYLYKNFNILEVDARRMISAKKETRSGCKEVIVTNY